ncbi:chaperonin 10-like protein [Xylaria digitata]|nr:chaperonin 10-like protein [Xylaria digitata]
MRCCCGPVCLIFNSPSSWTVTLPLLLVHVDLTLNSEGMAATTKTVVVVRLKEAAVREVLMLIVRDGWVLVKVKAVALSPTNWKHVEWEGADVGCRVGCDYAGIVGEVGNNVTNFKKGDRITGWIHGSNRVNHESGSFAEYAIAKAAVQ